MHGPWVWGALLLFQLQPKYRSGCIICTYMPHSPPTQVTPSMAPKSRRERAKSFSWPWSPAQPVQLRFSCLSAQLHCFLRLSHAATHLFFQDHVHSPHQVVLCVRKIPLLLSCSLIHLPAVGLPSQGRFPSPHRLIKCFVTNLLVSNLLPCKVLVSGRKLTFITVVLWTLSIFPTRLEGLGGQDHICFASHRASGCT